MREHRSTRIEQVQPSAPSVELLYIPDIAKVRRTTESAARRAVLRGECGPYLRVGRRLAVRFESFQRALVAAETEPLATAVQPLRQSTAWADPLLRSSHGEGAR